MALSSFQKTVVGAAAFVLIILLYFIYSTMRDNAVGDWPPVVGQCPDYWNDRAQDGRACVNTHRLGKCNIPTADDLNPKNFNMAPYSGDDGDCAKYKWAKSCGVEWDGITYSVSNPCDNN